jgi:hypothetical protein
VWAALLDAADGMPPLYHALGHLAGRLPFDPHLSYRIPSIVGMIVTVVSLYAVMERRMNRVAALVGDLFLFSTIAAGYVIEARSYTLMIGATAVAVLAWQRLADSPWYGAAFAAALACAVSLHYYSLFVWAAFGLAEGVYWFRHREIRWPTWLAMAAGVLPMLWFWPLLASLRQVTGAHFWANPTLGARLIMPILFTNLGNAASGATTGMLIWVCLRWRQFTKPKTSDALAIPAEEAVLVITLMLLPSLMGLVTYIAGAGMIPRYGLSGVVGFAMAAGYVSSRVKPALRSVLLLFGIGALLNATLPGPSGAAQRGLPQDRAMEASQLTAGLDTNLPVVVSDGLVYLPMAYYTPRESGIQLFYLLNSKAALHWTGSDTVDLTFDRLRRHYPIGAVQSVDFTQQHREFLLITGKYEDDGCDWWAKQFKADGHKLELLRDTGTRQVYRVTIVSENLSLSR